MEKDASGNIIVKGSITMTVAVMHHTFPVGDINVYLKKNVTTWPMNDTINYDMMTTADPGGVAQFHNLFTGNYFVYAKGFDVNWGAPVFGGYPIVLNSSAVSNNEFDYTLYVNE